MSSTLPGNYGGLLKDLKSRIQTAQVKAALAANAELVHLYWDIGHLIVVQQEKEGWGKSVVERLAHDLQTEFPDQKGLSVRNIRLMRQFYHKWNQSPIKLQRAVAVLGQELSLIPQFTADEFLQQAVAEIETSANLAQPVRDLEYSKMILHVLKQIPWGQNLDLISKLKEPEERLWYALKTVENGWSRPVLTAQIESKLIDRQGQAVTNFKSTLPEAHSDLAQGIFKDRYLIDFVLGGEAIKERQLEKKLTNRITDFLMELGKGFAFVGRQYRLDVGGDEFYIDLLFYHLKLHCYVVVDLKMEKFDPRDAGQINFYLEAIDRQVRDAKKKRLPSV